MAASTRSAPAFKFQWDSSLEKWNIPAEKWLEHHQSKLDGICVGVLVFNREGRVLLIQRASHDSMPNRWEIPGGAVDKEDPSMLFGAARELWEESGLVATRFKHFVPEIPGKEVGQIFTNRYGTKSFCRFSFEADVESSETVKLDPEEHQAFVWATEAEVREQKIGDRDIPITIEPVQHLILEAFRLRSET
ncbi:RNA pyrophosphohydrolase [Paramyrothecium foliicola]|nr:RNA pyrophosphohydrolase [Paramyrothecium foliicola]